MFRSATSLPTLIVSLFFALSSQDILAADTDFFYPEDNWELIGIARNYIIQIDTNSIRKKGHSYKVWSYKRFSRRTCYDYCDFSSRPVYFISEKTYFEFNCEEEQYRQLAYQRFDRVYQRDEPLDYPLLDANKNPTSSPWRELIDSNNRISNWYSFVDSDEQLIAKRICR
jgi:hypothetical protein